jgi:hypothetical protein
LILLTLLTALARDPTAPDALPDTARKHLSASASALGLGAGARVAEFYPWFQVAIGGERAPAFATSSVTLASTVTSNIALENARADLRRRGVALDGVPLYVGDGMSAVGTALMIAGTFGMSDEAGATDEELLMASMGWAMHALSIIPIGIQHGRIQAGYRRAGEREADSEVTLKVWPTADLSSQSLGIAGSF